MLDVCVTNIKQNTIASVDIIIADLEGDIQRIYKMGKTLSNGYENRIGHEVDL